MMTSAPTDILNRCTEGQIVSGLRKADPTANENTAAMPSYIAGVDTIRLFLAVLVVLSHGMQPPLFPAKLVEMHWAVAKIKMVYLWAFNGQAAVVAFFVISGFCIHFPFANGRPIEVRSFYLNRFLRIGIPLFFALIFSWTIGHRRPGDMEAVPIWSLYAEMAYYLAYPCVFAVRRMSGKYGFNLLLGLAGSASLGLSVLWGIATVHFHDNAGPVYWRSIVVGFPIWLSGIYIADNYQQLKQRLAGFKLNNVRLFVFLLSTPLVPLAYLCNFGLRFSLLLYSVPLAVWFACEVCQEDSKKPWDTAESLGRASYSVYLIHPAVLFLTRSKTNSMTFGDWLFAVASIGVASALLYRIAEKPSHQVARRITQRRRSSSEIVISN